MSYDSNGRVLSVDIETMLPPAPVVSALVNIVDIELDVAGQVTDAIASDGTVIAAATAAAADAVDAEIADKSLVSDTPIDDSANVAWGFLTADSPPRLMFGQYNDGTLYGLPSSLPDARLVDIPSDGWNWAVLTADDPPRVLFGQRTDGSVYGAAGPTVAVATPIILVGDSLTANWGNATLGTKLGRTSTNIGVGGQTSPQIAARFGAAPVLLTVTGNVIPASGAVTVTAWSTNLAQRTSEGSLSFTGLLAGVPGTLTGTRTVDDYSYTFTRSSAGIETPCPAGSPFKTGFGYRDALPVICLGRNNFKTTGDDVQIVADINACLNWTKRRDRALVLSIPPWDGEYVGGTYASIRTKLDTANAAIKAAFPTMWLDTAAHLRSAAVLASVGITATSQDLTDIGHDITPTSFRQVGDDGHYNSDAYTAINNLIAAEYTARGWTD